MKKTLVIGAGVSGRAAVHYLLFKGKSVIVVDRDPLKLSQIPPSPRLSWMLEADFNRFDEVEEVVLSSGVRPHHPLAQCFPVLGEAELVLRDCSQRCIGITGTNGKTTVTLMIEHVLNKAGMKACAVGNIGRPLTDYFLSPEEDEILVIELSSYQLETLSAPVFDAAVILNITPDHLDQYASMEDYAAAKLRLQRCMKPERSIVIQEKAALEFGRLFEENDRYSLLEDKKIASLLSLKYRSRHDCENACAAWQMVKGLGVTEAQFLEALTTFVRPAHRIEFVAEIEGVSYFDDSKGTNIDAVVQAVGAMTGSTVLIAGGVDKGSSYTPWIESFGSKVKKILAIGQAASKIQNELASTYEVTVCVSLDDAVMQASQEAVEGDSVLLSPGCASFDMFRDYAHRGEEFKRCVEIVRRKS
jgi:UDP-N-acetylmuramoylalanine--D-glutamate ligase